MFPGSLYKRHETKGHFIYLCSKLILEEEKNSRKSKLTKCTEIINLINILNSEEERSLIIGCYIQDIFNKKYDGTAIHPRTSNYDGNTLVLLANKRFI